MPGMGPTHCDSCDREPPCVPHEGGAPPSHRRPEVKWLQKRGRHARRIGAQALHWILSSGRAIGGALPQDKVEDSNVRHTHHWAALAAVLALSAAGDPRPAGAGANEPLAPLFTVRGLDGRNLRLSEFKGRAVVLDFWATWCAPCRASLPHLNDVQGRFGGRGLVVLGLSVDDAEPQTIRRFADRLGVKFRMAMADEHVLDLYGPIRTIPTTFFINRRGEVTRRVVGYIDPETLEAYVRELF